MKSVFRKKSAKSCWIIFFASAIVLSWCSSSIAENVIGQDEILNVPTISFLQDQGGYEDYFNFFVTLELLVALIALLFRWMGRIMRS